MSTAVRRGERPQLPGTRATSGWPLHNTVSLLPVGGPAEALHSPAEERALSSSRRSVWHRARFKRGGQERSAHLLAVTHCRFTQCSGAQQPLSPIPIHSSPLEPMRAFNKGFSQVESAQSAVHELTSWISLQLDLAQGHLVFQASSVQPVFSSVPTHYMHE